MNYINSKHEVRIYRQFLCGFVLSTLFHEIYHISHHSKHVLSPHKASNMIGFQNHGHIYRSKYRWYKNKAFIDFIFARVELDLSICFGYSCWKLGFHLLRRHLSVVNRHFHSTFVPPSTCARLIGRVGGWNALFVRMVNYKIDFQIDDHIVCRLVFSCIFEEAFTHPST